MKNYLQKGFSLIETFVVVGTITFIAAGVFTSVNKQINNAQTSSLSKTIEQLDYNIRSAFITIGDTSTLNNNMLAINGLLPRDLIFNASNNDILTSIGTNIVVQQSPVIGNKSYQITVQVPTVNCTNVLSDKIMADSVNILINDIVVKQNGVLVTDPLAIITNSCQRDMNNVSFNNIIQVSGSMNNPTGNPNPIRLQDSSAMISSPTTLDINNGAASCPVGTTANIFQGCTCPADTRWNGFSCSDIQSVRNNCGQGLKKDYATGVCVVANPVNVNKIVALDPVALAARFSMNDLNISLGANPTLAATSGIFAANNVTANIGSVTGANTQNLLTNGPLKSVATTATVGTSFNTTISKNVPNQYAFNITSSYSNTEVMNQCIAIGGHFMGQSCQVCMANSIWDGSRCARTP